VRPRVVAYYLVMSLVLFVLVTKAHGQFLPSGLASQIGHNSEAFLFAIVVSAAIQLRRRLHGPIERAALTIGGGLVLIVLGVLLLHTGWRSSLVTLNEPMIGAGLVLLYLTLPRSPKVALAVTTATLLFIFVFFDTPLVLNQAESLVPLLLAGPALDVFDRTILQPETADTPGLRLTWMALLLVAGVGFALVASWARQDLQGGFRLSIDYGQRAAEAYWGWLFVHLYFSYWLGRLWRSSGVRTPASSVAR